MTTTLVFAACLIASYFGVAAFRAWGKKGSFLDIPNERSSHVKPTPRGGGIAIVVVSLTFYVAASWLMPWMFSWGYIAGAVLVAAISLVDDIYTIPVVWRLLTHSAAAILLIVDKGYWHEIALPGTGVSVNVGIYGAVITFVWIVWLINAYNFMDGIDGIAGVQAVVAAAAWMAVGWLTNSATPFYLGGAILFSSLGFLIHNWQPARIFMGDVGSAFLGFSFAAMPLLAVTGREQTDDLLPVAAILFVWLFVFDSVVTFLRRAFRREKVWRAHREHLYQRLVSSGMSHASVSTLYGVLAMAVSLSVVYIFTGTATYDLAPFLTAAVATIALLLLYLWKMWPAKHAKDTK
jgi:UDP-N-acetylmuramyl pentapeptide phosphotransferase/UDP-N-acetylglucosamine-1-phosphate transferase